MNKSKTNEGSIISSAFALTASTLIVKILGVVYKVPLARFLGEEGMGYFNSAYTVYTLFYILCTAGVPKAVMIFISERTVSKEKIVSVAIKSFFVIGAVVTVIFALLSVPLSRLVGSSRAYSTMLAISPSILFIALSGVIRGYLSADMRFLDVAVSQIIEGATKLVLGLLFATIAIKSNCSVAIVSAFTMLGVTLGAFSGLVYLVSVSKINILDNISKQIEYRESKSVRRQIFHVSIPITVSAAIMSITNIIDLGMVMRRLEDVGYTETEAVSMYGNLTTLAMPIFNLALSVISPISIAFLPIFTKSYSRGDTPTLKSSISSSLEFTALLSAPIVFGTLVYAEDILSLLFGNIGISLGAFLLRLLIVGVIFMSLILIINSSLEAMGNVRVPVIAMLVGSIFKLIISYFLIGNSNYRVAGAPIGTVISYMASLMVSLIIFVKRAGYFPPILRTNIPPYFCAFCSVMLSTLPNDIIKIYLPRNLAFLITLPICALIYVLLCFIFGIFSKKKIKEMSKYTKAC